MNWPEVREFWVFFGRFMSVPLALALLIVGAACIGMLISPVVAAVLTFLTLLGLVTAAAGHWPPFMRFVDWLWPDA